MRSRSGDQPAGRAEALRASLVDRVARWSTGQEQVVTADPGLTFYRHAQPTEVMSCMVEPAIAFPIQGTKRAVLGDHVFAYDTHRFLVTSLDLPLLLQVVEASPEVPYLSLVLRLDRAVIAELMLQGRITPSARQRPTGPGLFLGDTSEALLEPLDRLVRLLDEPDSVPVLAPLIHKEIFYRLLTGEHGLHLWHLASAGSHGHRISRAIDWLKTCYSQPLRVDELASRVQMSPSRFHYHFRQLTSMSPLQFQKWVRLNEARRRMITEGMDASTAAFEVGYESPSQFSREYSRQFGAPPRRDISALMHLHEDAGSDGASLGALP